MQEAGEKVAGACACQKTETCGLVGLVPATEPLSLFLCAVARGWVRAQLSPCTVHASTGVLDWALVGHHPVGAARAPLLQRLQLPGLWTQPGRCLSSTLAAALGCVVWVRAVFGLGRLAQRLLPR